MEHHGVPKSDAGGDLGSLFGELTCLPVALGDGERIVDSWSQALNRVLYVYLVGWLVLVLNR